jgi:hypothetical protein
MGITATRADERVHSVTFTEDAFTVELKDGRAITTPLAWFPRLLHATAAQRETWQVSGAGYGIHWPEVDEDISTEGLLRGAPAPRGTAPAR